MKESLAISPFEEKVVVSQKIDKVKENGAIMIPDSL